MSAQLMKGLVVAKQLREKIAGQAAAFAARGITPTLNVLLVGSDPASQVYAESKIKVGRPLGIRVTLTVLPENTGQEQVEQLLGQWRKDPRVHGVLIELPLPAHLNKFTLFRRLSPLKDVDGVHPLNWGYALAGMEDSALTPATPQACMALLDYYGINLKGRRVTLVGRGETVGRPMIGLLLKRDATLTVCHSRTVNMAEHCRQAQVLVAAVGAAGLITPDMLSPGVVVLDAGINPTPGGEGICGDVDPAAEDVASWLSPVPGGVGSLTTTVIMANLIKAINLQIAAGRPVCD